MKVFERLADTYGHIFFVFLKTSIETAGHFSPTFIPMNHGLQRTVSHLFENHACAPRVLIVRGEIEQ